MTRWVNLACCEQGTRERNDDSVQVYNIRRAGGNIEIIAVCDGIGSLPGSNQCAKAVSEAAITIAANFIKRRRARKLSIVDAARLRSRLERMRIAVDAQGGGTTLALVVFERRRRGNEYRGIVIWAGDTQVSMLETTGAMRLITNNHHDEEGRLTSYIKGTGEIQGQLELVLFSSRYPCALSITTDGVHEHCRSDELKQFIIYCVDHRIRSSRRFSADLSTFLRENVGDNFSAVLVYRLLSRQDLATMIGNQISANLKP